jgi:hypothetical protein
MKLYDLPAVTLDHQLEAVAGQEVAALEAVLFKS